MLNSKITYLQCYSFICLFLNSADHKAKCSCTKEILKFVYLIEAYRFSVRWFQNQIGYFRDLEFFLERISEFQLFLRLTYYLLCFLWINHRLTFFLVLVVFARIVAVEASVQNYILRWIRSFSGFISCLCWHFPSVVISIFQYFFRILLRYLFLILRVLFILTHHHHLLLYSLFWLLAAPMLVLFTQRIHRFVIAGLWELWCCMWLWWAPWALHLLQEVAWW